MDDGRDSAICPSITPSIYKLKWRLPRTVATSAPATALWNGGLAKHREAELVRCRAEVGRNLNGPATSAGRESVSLSLVSLAVHPADVVRRLRCDRQHPCNNCLRRELGASCTYPAENETTPRVRKHPVSVQDRVQHLEKLLMEMVQGQNGQQSPQASSTCPCATPDPLPSQVQSSRPSIVEDASAVDTDSSPPASDCGMMHCTPSGTNYVSSAHWAAVLDDIAVLKTQTQTQMQTEMQTETQTQTQTQKQTVCPPEPAPNRDSPQLLYGCTKLATKEDLLASIPARPVVDHLVSGYFASFELSPGTLAVHFG